MNRGNCSPRMKYSVCRELMRCVETHATKPYCISANSWFILNPLAHSNRILLLSIRNCLVWNSLRQFLHAWGLTLGTTGVAQQSPAVLVKADAVESIGRASADVASSRHLMFKFQQKIYMTSRSCTKYPKKYT